jgi:hypothetical protein
MTIDEVLHHFKSEYKVCQLLGIGRQNLQQLEIEKLSGGVLKANIQDLYDRYTHHSEKTKQGINKNKGISK